MILRRKSKLRYVQQEKTRHGRITYYFRIGNGLRTRLPGQPGEPEFLDTYAHLLNHGDPRDEPAETHYRRAVLRMMSRRFRKARLSDQSKERKTTIDMEWIQAELARRNYRCALTNMKFSLTKAGSRLNTYGPSLDRIDSSKGYEKGNVRIVVFAANVMMLDWGLDVFEKVSKEYNQNILCPHLETGCGE